MNSRAASDSMAGQARRLYTEELVKGLTPLVQSVMDHARTLQDKPSERAVFQRRRELMQGLMTGAQNWHRAMVAGLRKVLLDGVSVSRLGDLPPPGSREALTLVPDDTIELEIVTSRLALAIMDRASWEFADLRSRVAHLEGRSELDPHDMLRAHVLARIVFDGWRSAGLTLDGWRELQTVLHDELALLVEESYHETNRWLIGQDVLPEVDLRPFIRRARTHPNAPLGWQAGMGMGAQRDDGPGHGGFTGASGSSGFGGWSGGGRGGVGEETRMMTRAAPLARSREHAEAVLGLSLIHI